jgi:hypothetical protein
MKKGREEQGAPYILSKISTKLGHKNAIQCKNRGPKIFSQPHIPPQKYLINTITAPMTVDNHRYIF